MAQEGASTGGGCGTFVLSKGNSSSLNNIYTMKTLYTRPREWEQLTRADQLERAKRRIDLLVIHCSATPRGRRYFPPQLIKDHQRRGFSTAGYHYYITREGDLFAMRPVSMVGAHAKGYNRYSIGICYEGGLDEEMRPCDTRTAEQRQMLTQLIYELKRLYPNVMVVGHRDLSPDRNGDGQVTSEEWIKVCPCFEAKVYNLSRSL